MERGPGEVLGVRGRSLESCWFLLEKNFLRYGYCRLIDVFSCYLSSISLVDVWIFVCLGWIMKATYCLLRYDPKLMFEVVNLNMPCFYCEIFHNHANSCIYCVYSHLIGGLTGGS